MVELHTCSEKLKPHFFVFLQLQVVMDINAAVLFWTLLVYSLGIIPFEQVAIS